MFTDNIIMPEYSEQSADFHKLVLEILTEEKVDEFDVVNMLSQLQRTLRQQQKWVENEKNFVNFALANCIHYIDSAKTKENFIKIYQNVQEKVFSFDFSSHDRGFFYDKKLYTRLISIMENDAEQAWIEKNKREPEAEYQFIDIEQWKRPEVEESEDVKVSIIIPFYNVEKYLGQCLDSIVNQTLKEIEIICVNDGSTDTSLSVLEEYAAKDSRIIIVSQQNEGQSSARNNALKRATGEYILFVDSDDYLDLRAVEYLYYEVKSRNLDQLYFSAEVFYEDCEDKFEDTYYLRKHDYSEICTGKQFFVNVVKNAEFKPAPVLYISRAEFIFDNHLRFENGIIHEDNLFTAQCLYYAQKVCFHNINLYYRRVRRNSTMTGGQNIRHAYCYYRVIKELEQFVQEKRETDFSYLNALVVQLGRMAINAEKYLEDVNLDELVRNINETDFAFINWLNLIRDERERAESMYTRAVAAEESLRVSKYNVQYCKLDYQKKENALKTQYAKLEEERKALKKIRTSIMQEGGNTMPKVSIIIPTYNVEDYLVECMESITNQTLKDIEIICINDGSTDGSLEILKRYEQVDPRIILVDKENGGYGIGMNIGLEKATGEYIGILEPDDYVPINMYEDLYHIAKENELDFVKADFYRFTRDEDESMNLVYNHLSKNKADYNKLFNPSETPEAIRYIMNTWSGIYRRDFLNEHSIRHNETPGASFQDNGFWFQTFVYAKRAMIIDKPYYRNRRDNPNSSVKNPQKVYCMNVEYDHIRNILMKDEELWERFKYMYSLKKWHNYNATLKRISEEFKREYVDRISEEFKRAQVKKELSEDCFTVKEWEKITLLINSPQGFYNTYVVKNATNAALKKELKKTKKELKKAKAQVQATKSSITFRVGKIIMFIPYHLKKLIKKK